MSPIILLEYLPIFIFLVITLVLSILFVLLSLVFGQKNSDPEKVSAYECGFNPFEDSRRSFDVRFYLVAILFILFDIEVILVLPIVLSVSSTSLSGLFFFILFLFVMTAGFLYEWKKGALTWS